MIDEPWIRGLCAAIIRAALDSLTVEHYDALTQEPPLTARAGERLEGLIFSGLPNEVEIRIVTQDLPDRGPGSLEKKLGTDLYVGVEVIYRGRRKTKGILVQAKWNDPRSEVEEERLRDQCRTMLDKSEDSYVWSYGKTGIGVTHATDHVEGSDEPGPKEARDLGDLFEGVLECTEGDPDIGLPEGPSTRAELRRMLERLGRSSGFGIQIKV